MSTSVKHIHSGMRGVPTVNGVAGTLIPALDVATQTGCGITTAIAVTVASNIATAGPSARSAMPSGGAQPPSR